MSTHTSRDTNESGMPSPGERIGNLVIIDTLATGGSGMLFKARHEGLEVVRVVKLLKPLAMGNARDRLLTEAKIAAHLIHPNIVQIHNVGLWNDIPYIEMEYVDGDSLKSILEARGSLPYIVAAALIYILCKALVYANNRSITVYGNEYFGLVHRDIKPANILISGGGVVKLTDFGIALPGNVSLHTTELSVVGTAPYISPEQFNCEQLDTRTDIYALGAVFYEMVAGVNPFIQKTISELLTSKMTGAYKSVCTLNPAIPVEIERIIDRCLKTDRNRRFDDAGCCMSVLKNFFSSMQEHDPEIIVRDYFQNKRTRIIESITTSLPSKKKRSRAVPVLIIVLIATIPLGTIIWKYGLSHRNRKQFNDSTENIGQPVSPYTSDETYSDTSADGNVPVSSTSSRKTGNMPASDAEPSPVRPQGIGNEFGSGAHDESSRVSSISRGLEFYHQKKYGRALPLLQQALLRKERFSKKKRLSLHLKLFECAVHEHDTLIVNRYVDSIALPDGYYYYLRAKVLAERGRLDKAEQAAVKARTLPSLYGEQASSQALYFLATLLEKQYRMKPNRSNRLKAAQTWESYISEQCAGTAEAYTGHCSEARLALRELER